MELDCTHFGANTHMATVFTRQGESERALFHYINAIKKNHNSGASFCGMMLETIRHASDIQEIEEQLQEKADRDRSPFTAT